MGELFLETKTLSHTHTHCGCVLHSVSSIIKIIIKFLPPSEEQAAKDHKEKTSRLGLHLHFVPP